MISFRGWCDINSALATFVNTGASDGGGMKGSFLNDGNFRDIFNNIISNGKDANNQSNKQQNINIINMNNSKNNNNNITT